MLICRPCCACAWVRIMKSLRVYGVGTHRSVPDGEYITLLFSKEVQPMVRHYFLPLDALYSIPSDNSTCGRATWYLTVADTVFM